MMNLRINTGKRAGAALLIWLVFIFYQGSVLAQSQTNVNIDDAVSVVNQYMWALSGGDTGTLSKLLDEELLKTKKSTFSNPGYSRFLIKLYKNSSYEIVDSEIKDNGMVAVDVMVTYPGKDQSSFRLWLKNSDSVGLRVFMETEIRG